MLISSPLLAEDAPEKEAAKDLTAEKAKEAPAEEVTTRRNISSRAYYYYILAQVAIRDGDRKGAIELYKEALKEDPASATLNADLAFLYVRERDNPLAVSHLTKTLSINPDHHMALMLLGELYATRNIFDKAEENLNKAIKVKPEKQKAYLILANVFVNQSKYDEALETYKRLLDINPDSVLSYYYLGKIEAERYNFEIAVDHFMKALEINPSFTAIYLELGSLYEREKELTKAISTYKDAIKVAPKDIKVRKRLAQLLFQESKLDEALEHFEWIARLDPSKIEAFVMTGIINYEMKNYKEAAEWFEDTLELNPNVEKIRFFLGATYEELDKADKAIEALSLVPSDDPSYGDATQRLAYLYIKKGQHADSIKAIKNAIKVKGADPSLYNFLVSIHRDSGDLEEARKVAEESVKAFPKNTDLLYRLGELCDVMEGSLACLDYMYKIIEIDPDYASALNYIAYTYVEAGVNLNKAETYINQALEANPESGHIIDSLGWLHFKKGNIKRAVRELERAYKYLPNDPVVAEHLGDAYLGMSSKVKALTFYEKAFTLDPENSTIEDKINKLREDMGN